MWKESQINLHYTQCLLEFIWFSFSSTNCSHSIHLDFRLCFGKTKTINYIVKKVLSKLRKIKLRYERETDTLFSPSFPLHSNFLVSTILNIVNCLFHERFLIAVSFEWVLQVFYINIIGLLKTFLQYFVFFNFFAIFR